MGVADYKTVVSRQEDGAWVAEIPAVAGCYALMPTRQEALEELAQHRRPGLAHYRGNISIWHLLILGSPRRDRFRFPLRCVDVLALVRGLSWNGTRKTKKWWFGGRLSMSRQISITYCFQRGRQGVERSLR